MWELFREYLLVPIIEVYILFGIFNVLIYQVRVLSDWFASRFAKPTKRERNVVIMKSIGVFLGSIFLDTIIFLNWVINLSWVGFYGKEGGDNL